MTPCEDHLLVSQLVGARYQGLGHETGSVKYGTEKDIHGAHETGLNCWSYGEIVLRAGKVEGTFVGSVDDSERRHNFTPMTQKARLDRGHGCATLSLSIARGLRRGLWLFLIESLSFQISYTWLEPGWPTANIGVVDIQVGAREMCL